MAQIDQILNRLDRLPAIPVAVTQLISNLCSSSDDPDKESTAHIVMRDSALTASVTSVTPRGPYTVNGAGRPLTQEPRFTS